MIHELLPIVALVGMIGFLVGIVPIPVGYERGKVAWLKVCGTGWHTHIVYHTDNGFQTLHPDDRSKR